MSLKEFQIRAWQCDPAHAQVIVHSSPAGDLRKPIRVPCDVSQLDDARQLFHIAHWYRRPDLQGLLVDMGRKLAKVLLPRPVYALLTSSLTTVTASDILRIRLCLDPALIDLPWEYLYRPDVLDQPTLTGFLLFDHRISLVREAPTATSVAPAQQKTQRMVFAGTLRSDGEDQLGVHQEYTRLSKALISVREFLILDEFLPASGNNIEKALFNPAAIFHYSGDTGNDKGRGYLIREMRTGSRDNRATPLPELMYGDELSPLLQKACTQLAVFSACNSGRWAFVKPLLQGGLPGLIGTQGEVSIKAAFAFSEKLYGELAVGLSLDEAVIHARFHELQFGGFDGRDGLEWGVFMVYLPATEIVLLPDAERQSMIAPFQEAARRDLQQAIANTTQRNGPLPQTADQVNKTDLRRAIIEHYTLDDLELLCADLKQDIAQEGIELDLALDMVGGESEPNKVLNLIGYLDRNHCLTYLMERLRKEHPGII